MKVHAAARSTLVGQGPAVLFWKVAEYAGLALFVIVVPRLMGPDLYGRYALILSLVAMFTIAIGLGTGQVFGRFVPEYEQNQERWKTQHLFMEMLLLRTALAGLIGGAFAVTFRVLLPETSSLTLAAGAAAFVVGAVAFTCFQIFFGLNALGRWLVYQSLTKPVLFAFIIALGGVRSLESATFALLMTQLVFLVVGVYWARTFFTFKWSALSVSFLFPHLRFGLSFFGANLLMMAVWRGGEPIVLAFSGKPEEVAFFNIASSIAMAFGALVSQLAVMVIPSLTALHVSGEEEEVTTGLGYVLKYLTIVCFGFLFAVHLVAGWAVVQVLGEEYAQVAANLKVLALGVLPLALVRTGFSMATVYKQPGKVLHVAAPALVVFVVAAAVLVPLAGSYGASAAVTLAVFAAGLMTYHQFAIAPVLTVARFRRLLLVGLAALGVLALPSFSVIPMGLIAITGFFAFLFVGKVISIGELRQIYQARLAH